MPNPTAPALIAHADVLDAVTMLSSFVPPEGVEYLFTIRPRDQGVEMLARLRPLGGEGMSFAITHPPTEGTVAALLKASLAMLEAAKKPAPATPSLKLVGLDTSLMGRG